MKEVVNSLWIGKTLSSLELLTLKSFIKNGYKFRLWVYEPLETATPKEVEICDANLIISNEKIFSYKKKNKFGHGKGSYAGFSDIFRYKLLYEYGGWWTDMDVTCLKEIYTDSLYFFREHHQLKVVGNVIRVPKNSELMKLCYEEALSIIDENNEDWHKPIKILNKNIKYLNLDKYIRPGLSNSDFWQKTSRYIKSNKEIPKNWCFIHWQNEEWRSRKLNKDNINPFTTLGKLYEKYNLQTGKKTKFRELRAFVGV